jgi:hypothetical protein
LCESIIVNRYKGIQGALASTSLAILALRVWVRINLRRQSILLSDYLILFGWLPALAVVVCNAVTLQKISKAGEDVLINGYQLQVSESQLKVCAAKFQSFVH